MAATRARGSAPSRRFAQLMGAQGPIPGAPDDSIALAIGFVLAQGIDSYKPPVCGTTGQVYVQIACASAVT